MKLLDRVLIGLVLIVHGDHTGRSQDCLVQPAEAEEDDERADDELERQLGDAGDDQLPEQKDEHGERDQGHDRAIKR